MKRGKREHTHLQDEFAVPHPRELQYLDFFYTIERAKAEAEVELVEVWRSQAKENWQAARDLLARRYPERWGRTDKLRINLPDSDLDSAIEKELARLATGGEVAQGPDSGGTQALLQMPRDEAAE